MKLITMRKKITAGTTIPEENNRKKENGGRIKVYIKPECGHHPHGLENYKMVVDEIEKYSKENLK